MGRISRTKGRHKPTPASGSAPSEPEVGVLATEAPEPVETVPATSPPPRSLLDLVRSVEVEDFILFLWIAVIQQVIESQLGGQLRAVAALGTAPAWIYAVVFGGLAVVFYTRGPADFDLNAATSRRCVLGLLGWSVARSYFGGNADWPIKAFVVAIVVVILIAPLNSLERLPRTGLGLRRTLVLPAQLVGNSVFSGMITPDFLRGSELPGIAPEHRLFASLVLSAFLFLYVIVAPRVMAGGDWRPLTWTVRLGVYLGALWLGRPPWLEFGW